MLPLSPVLLFVAFPAALFVAAQGAGDLQGFLLPGGSTVFDPTGKVARRCMDRRRDWIELYRLGKLRGYVYHSIVFALR